MSPSRSATRAASTCPARWPRPAGVASLVYGLLSATSHGWSAPSTLITIALGLVLLGCFVVLERRVRQPLMPLRLFADRNRAVGYASFALGPAAMMSTVLPAHSVPAGRPRLLADPYRDGVPAAGVGDVHHEPGGARDLLPRFGPRPLVLGGAAMMAGGLAWLSQLQAGTSYAGGILGPLLLMGTGGGLAFIPLAPTIFASVPPPTPERPAACCRPCSRSAPAWAWP